MIVTASAGIVGLVTSHGFLDNPFVRGMRSSLLASFDRAFVLDLHGNALRHELAPDGSQDKNVFDIKRTGVAISLLRRSASQVDREIQHADLWGEREEKYPWLTSHSLGETPTVDVSPRPPNYLMIPEDTETRDEFERGFSIADIMPTYSKGCVTGRDAFVIDFDSAALLERMRVFAQSSKSDDELVEEFNLNPSAWWDVRKARTSMPRRADMPRYVRPLLYRPFDVRPCFYHPSVFMSPRRPVMKHIDPDRHNLMLVTSRMTKGERFRHVTVSNQLAEAILLSSKTSNNAIVFPLYLYSDQKGNTLAPETGRQPNFTETFIAAIRSSTQLEVVDGRGDLNTTIGFEDVFDYIVAILHSTSYRDRYMAPLSRDFPRIYAAS